MNFKKIGILACVGIWVLLVMSAFADDPFFPPDPWDGPGYQPPCSSCGYNILCWYYCKWW